MSSRLSHHHIRRRQLVGDLLRACRNQFARHQRWVGLHRPAASVNLEIWISYIAHRFVFLLDWLQLDRCSRLTGLLGSFGRLDIVRFFFMSLLTFVTDLGWVTVARLVIWFFRKKYYNSWSSVILWLAQKIWSKKCIFREKRQKRAGHAGHTILAIF